MRFSLLRNFFFLSLLIWVVCCAGCGKVDKNVREIMKQVENSRSLDDFDRLIAILDSNKKISAPVREECRKLAFDIFLEKIEAAWKAEDSEGLDALAQHLTDPVCEKVNGTPLRERIRECLADLQKRKQTRERELYLKKLSSLESQLHLCDFRKVKNLHEQLVKLENLCAGIENDEITEAFSLLITYGLVLTGRELPETLPNPKRLQQKKVLDMCSRCRTDGREPCYSCHGTGVCSRCKGTGYKKVHTISKVWRGTENRLEQRFAESEEPCPNKFCSLCKGDKFLMSRCKKCRGLKYIINIRKLRGLYNEQYRHAHLTLQNVKEAWKEVPAEMPAD